METRTDITAFADKMGEIRRQIADVIVGQAETVDMLLTCLVADGHVLLEGVPGVAKTLLARLVARLVDARFSRIQFTPDLMPSDVLGTSVFNQKTSDFDFHAGPAFTDILLADEINRAPAKTQAALFEVMEERQATVDGQTYDLGGLFTVIATQNPVEQEGTYRLPEAQLDRFLMKIVIGYPSVDEEVEILNRHNSRSGFARLGDVRPVVSKEELCALRRMTDSVVVDVSLLRYIAQIVAQSRESRAVYVGCSPRASVAMLRSAKAYALLHDRDFVTPDDIKAVAPSVMQHRLQLTAEAEMEGYTPMAVAQKLIENVEVPK